MFRSLSRLLTSCKNITKLNVKILSISLRSQNAFQKPHSHDRDETGHQAYWKKLGQTPAEAGNSCRNPESGPRPWCYTMDPKTRWEYCRIPPCAGQTFNIPILKQDLMV